MENSLKWWQLSLPLGFLWELGRKEGTSDFHEACVGSVRVRRHNKTCWLNTGHVLETAEWHQGMSTRCPVGRYCRGALVHYSNSLKCGCIICNRKTNHCLPQRVTTGFKWDHWVETLCKDELLCIDGWLWCQSGTRWLQNQAFCTRK